VKRSERSVAGRGETKKHLVRNITGAGEQKSNVIGNKTGGEIETEVGTGYVTKITEIRLGFYQHCCWLTSCRHSTCTSWKKNPQEVPLFRSQSMRYVEHLRFWEVYFPYCLDYVWRICVLFSIPSDWILPDSFSYVDFDGHVQRLFLQHV
jgi:hypothetical protein